MCSLSCAGQKEKILNLRAAMPVSRNLCASVGMKVEAESGTELLCRWSVYNFSYRRRL